MRKYLLLFSVLFSVLVCNAENRVVYFLYDYHINNSLGVRKKLDSLCYNQNGRTILYCASKMYEGDDITKILNDKYFLLHTDIYEKYADFSNFCALLDSILIDKVSGNDLVGDNDSQWTIYVLLYSETNNLTDIMRMLDVNGLFSRRVKLNFLLYDTDAKFVNLSKEEVIAQFDIDVLNF